MSYTSSVNELRYERKFYSNDVSVSQILNYFLTHSSSFKFAYPDRTINNIYYDTNEYSMYRHGIEGDARRVKVRVRWYGDILNSNITPVLEIKRKFGHVGDKLKWNLPKYDSTESMLKATQKIELLLDENVNNYDVLFTILPMVKPVLINRYERKYLISSDKKFRVTIDTSMSYFRSTTSETCLKDFDQIDGIVVEIKYLPEDHERVSIITSQIPIRLSKFSKYLNGIDVLYKSHKLFA
jgi:SPX domain protein involved in polyphosphate accumulation